MNRPIELVLSKLPDAKQSGSGWLARCPAHDDQNPSLSISEGKDGRVLLHCYAGCTPEAIVAAMGLKMSDLMPKNGCSKPLDCKSHGTSKAQKPSTVYATANKALETLERRHGKWSAIWPYSDDANQLVGYVVRWDRPDGKKDIRPVSYNGQGWVVGAIPEPRPLYCQNELKESSRVYVCEGEKATDAARSIGLTVVTSSGGSKAAAKTDWSPLAGRECIILPDNDKPGEGYADAVGKILTELDNPATVRVVKLPNLPPGGDVVDWIEANSIISPEGLREVIDKLADAVPSWKSEPSKPTLQMFQPFPVDVLPEPVKGFVKAGSKALGCDTTFIVLPLLTALASCIGATRRIKLKASWCEPAVVWAVVVSESGTLKSPSQSLALSVVNRLQASMLQKLPELVEQYQQDKALWESDMQNWKTKGRNKGEPMPESPLEPTVERYVISDITLEALVDRLRQSPRGLLCACDELAAWFGSLDAYRGGKGGDAAKWLSIHRAESVIVDRKTGPAKTAYVPFAAVSLCGGIQPAMLTRVLGRDHIENGLLARLLVSQPPRLAKRWTEAVVDGEIMRQMERLFGQLLALQFSEDSDSQKAPVDIPLSPEGKNAWISFYNEHADSQNEQSGALAAAFSKLEGYAARLALVLHLVRCASDSPPKDPEAIDRQSIEAGATMARWFAREAERVYAMFYESDENAMIRRLAEWITSKGGAVTVRETQRSRKYKTAKDAETALGKLVEAGIGRWETIPPTSKGGRAVAKFVVYDTGDSDTTYLKPEKNRGCVNRHSVTTPEVAVPITGNWGEV